MQMSENLSLDIVFFNEINVYYSEQKIKYK